MIRVLCRNAAIAALVVLVPRAVRAQGGYAEEKHAEFGLAFPMARDYLPIPVEPTEEWVVLQFAEKLPAGKHEWTNPNRFRPELRIVYIDWVPDPEPGAEPPAQGSGTEGGEPSGEKGSQDGDEDEDAGKAAAPTPPINSFGRYVEQELTYWKLGPTVPGKKHREYQGTELELRRKKSGQGLGGWAYTWVAHEQRTIALVGFCDKEELERQAKIWRYIAERTQISEPEDRNLDKLTRMYAGKKLIDIPYRIQARSQLVRGWKADDTENYIFVYSTKDAKLLSIAKSQLEAIRDEYAKVFPPAAPIQRVSTVRLCRDEAEFEKYGGLSSAYGYWNSATEELVLYDRENVDGKAGTGRAGARNTTLHEGFHQYIHYACGELPPHPWFNEGHGEYFEGARIAGGKVLRIGPSTQQLEPIQYLLQKEEVVPWSEFILQEQPEFMAKTWQSYAQAWSMIYFLRAAPIVKQRAPWGQILPRYFETLKSAWARESSALAAAGKEDDWKAELAAGKRAREEAVERAFQDIDIDTLEREWRKYILSLKAD